VYVVSSDKDMLQLVNDRVLVLNPPKDNLICDAQKVEEILGVPPERVVDVMALAATLSTTSPALLASATKVQSNSSNALAQSSKLWIAPRKSKRKLTVSRCKIIATRFYSAKSWPPSIAMPPSS